MTTAPPIPEPVKLDPTAALITGGLELAKFLVMLGIQEARRSNATPEEIETLLQDSIYQLEARDPANIPDGPVPA